MVKATLEHTVGFLHPFILQLKQAQECIATLFRGKAEVEWEGRPRMPRVLSFCT
jgi:hypothetical protein